MNKFLVKASKSFRRGEKGFTLVELLIVIAILGILAAIIIPNVARIIREGNISAARAEKAELQVGVDAATAAAQVSVIAGGDVGPGDTIIGIEAADDTDLTEWLVRTENIKGSWDIDTTGNITCTNYPGLDSSYWP